MPPKACYTWRNSLSDGHEVYLQNRRDRALSEQPNPKTTSKPFDGISRELCNELAHWRFDDLPSDVVRTIKLFLIDTFGVIGGAARAPGIAEINGRLTRWERDGSATSLIGKQRLSPPFAAMANGAAAHALDFDDMLDDARVHTFCVMLPTMLAAAEDIEDVDGESFLLSLAIGAEVHARLGFACYNCLGRGWHPTMTLGTLAAALGAGRLLNQTGDGLLNTLGLAFHQTSGTAQSMLDGVLAKRLGAGIAARNAVTAAFLSADGITGPFRPLEGPAGLFQLFERGEVSADELLSDLGQTWRIREFAVKPYPCCRCNHSTIEVALTLRDSGLRPEDVQSVEIGLPQVNFQTVGHPYEAARDSIVHAQFNVAYSFARALADGRVDLRTYTRPNITDPTIADLAGRVSAVVDREQNPTAMEPTRIRVTRTDGTQLVVRGNLAKGGPVAPMSEAEVLAKFRGCLDFGMATPTSVADSFAERLLAIEELDDVAVLVQDFPDP